MATRNAYIRMREFLQATATEFLCGVADIEVAAPKLDDKVSASPPRFVLFCLICKGFVPQKNLMSHWNSLKDIVIASQSEANQDSTAKTVLQFGNTLEDMVHRKKFSVSTILNMAHLVVEVQVSNIQNREKYRAKIKKEDTKKTQSQMCVNMLKNKSRNDNEEEKYQKCMKQFEQHARAQRERFRGEAKLKPTVGKPYRRSLLRHAGSSGGAVAAAAPG